MANVDYRYDQICELRRVCGSDSKLSSTDIKFASSLCDNYFARLSLSDKQWHWVGVLLERAGAMPSTASTSSGVEEVFSGQTIQSLLAQASGKLKFPKLRYQTDGGSKVVFGYVADRTNKWHNCIFVDNGGKAEGKKRYGFVNSAGNGRINRDAPPEIKALIRKAAENPTELGKLQGQKYSHCCFCGLELVNKSSVHYGYGPICAGNWGLPWGDTGDSKDEEEAAEEELKHIQLQDLG